MCAEMEPFNLSLKLVVRDQSHYAFWPWLTASHLVQWKHDVQTYFGGKPGREHTSFQRIVCLSVTIMPWRLKGKHGTSRDIGLLNHQFHLSHVSPAELRGAFGAKAHAHAHADSHEVLLSEHFVVPGGVMMRGWRQCKHNCAAPTSSTRDAPVT